MNSELLLKVRDHILEEPKRCDMSDWIRRSKQSPCGTIACIAGWACVLSGKRDTPYNDVPRVAGELLGLPETESLFLADDWPADLREELYSEDPGSKEYAEIVARRIDEFLLEHSE